MKVTIDRFEGEYAIIELPDMTFIDVPKVLFIGAQEGDVIDISIDNTETETRKKRIKGLMAELFRD
jgi:hypothetical protein